MTKFDNLFEVRFLSKALASCVPSAQISDAARLQAAGLDTRLVARRATESYLMQVLKHGFLHSGAPALGAVTPRDPVPGLRGGRVQGIGSAR